MLAQWWLYTYGESYSDPFLQNVQGRGWKRSRLPSYAEMIVLIRNTRCEFHFALCSHLRLWSHLDLLIHFKFATHVQWTTKVWNTPVPLTKIHIFRILISCYSAETTTVGFWKIKIKMTFRFFFFFPFVSAICEVNRMNIRWYGRLEGISHQESSFPAMVLSGEETLQQQPNTSRVFIIK